MGSKYPIKELIVLLIQVGMFYLYPLLVNDPMAMVMILLCINCLLSLLLGWISKSKLKWFYPLMVALAFIPSIYIYYNESAMVHALWYFVTSFSAIVVASLLKIVLKQLK